MPVVAAEDPDMIEGTTHERPKSNNGPTMPYVETAMNFWQPTEPRTTIPQALFRIPDELTGYTARAKQPQAVPYSIPQAGTAIVLHGESSKRLAPP